MISLLLLGSDPLEAVAAGFTSFAVDRQGSLFRQVRSEADLGLCPERFGVIVLAGVVSSRLADAVAASSVPFGYILTGSSVEALQSAKLAESLNAALPLSSATVVLFPTAKDAADSGVHSKVLASCRVLSVDEFCDAGSPDDGGSLAAAAMAEILLREAGKGPTRHAISGPELELLAMAGDAPRGSEIVNIDLDFPCPQFRPWEPFSPDKVSGVPVSIPSFECWQHHVVQALPLTRVGRALWKQLHAQVERGSQFARAWHLSGPPPGTPGLEAEAARSLRATLERAGINSASLDVKRDSQGNDSIASQTRYPPAPGGRASNQRRGELLHFNEERLR